MDAPIAPRTQDFGLTDEELPRLARHYYWPVTSGAGPAPGATVWVRVLRPKYFAILGVALAALWMFLSTRDAALTFVGLLLFGAWLGAIAGMITAGIIVRPLYLLIASAIVPGLRAFRRFEAAQVAYQEALQKFRLWQTRTLSEFWCSLAGVAFEQEVARLYQGLGYQVRLTPRSSDGGVDVVLEREGQVTAVQCKAHRKKIGIAVGRELVASAKDIGADRMMIACTHGASAPLQTYAREKGIQVVSAGDLAHMQMELKEMSAATLLIERPSSIAQRLKRRAAAPHGTSGSSRG